MGKGRTLVIGDVHGSFRGLSQVLTRCKWQPEDTIIQLGDVADGWSEVPECVDLLLSLPNVISIRGNHDVWCYDWFKYGDTPYLWTKQGGKATIDAYNRTGKHQDPFHISFWEDQKDWYIDDENRLFIHGGWPYAEPKQNFPEFHVGEISDMTLFKLQAGLNIDGTGLGSIAKECHWDVELLDAAKFSHPNGFKNLRLFKEIFIGHTSTQDALPHRYCNLWQMDTNAARGGVLTIMDVDTKQFWQSDRSRDLYPNEKGR